MMPWYMYVAEGFGLGKLPVAPGTWGSLGALFVAVPAVLYLPSALFLLILGLMACASIPLCEQASIYMARKDPDNVVLDEFIGQWIAVWPGIWVSTWSGHFWPLILSFLLFRFFDIVKVYPAYQLQSLEGGWGIVLDDVAAGIYAQVLLSLSGLFFGGGV